MPQAKEFNIGDAITVTDHHTSLGYPISYGCRVEGIDGDVYIVQRREFNAVPFRVGKYYPHMEIDKEYYRLYERPIFN